MKKFEMNTTFLTPISLTILIFNILMLTIFSPLIFKFLTKTETETSDQTETPTISETLIQTSTTETQTESSTISETLNQTSTTETQTESSTISVPNLHNHRDGQHHSFLKYK